MSNVEDNKDKRKEEILAKSRKSNSDEGMEYVENKGSKMGIYVAGTIVGAPLAFLSLLAGEMSTFFALITLYIAFGAGELFAMYRFFKQKRYLIGAVVIALLTVGVASMFVEMIGFLPGWVPRWWL